MSIIQTYIDTHDIKKLHVGAGGRVLPTWLNTDLRERLDKNIASLDASKTFPIESNTFDYVYSEHMIEHIPFRMGKKMLKECYRILKPGGKIRITAPDLNFLIDLYRNPSEPTNAAYIEWAAKFNNHKGPSGIFALNNFFYNFGHQFMYDEPTLTKQLTDAGFKNVKPFLIKKSDDPQLANLEAKNRLPKGFLQLESMTLQAEK